MQVVNLRRHQVGPATLVGPLLFTVLSVFSALGNAQEYVDLEAEQRNSTNTQPANNAPGLGALLYQMQQLQQEVMMLNGRVEELSHEVKRLKQQSLDRYVDLDRRIADAGIAQAGTAGTVSQTAGTTAATVTPPAASQSAAELPGESQRYRAAYALVRDQRFEEAVNAFGRFLTDFPDGRFAPNAHYWLGELYLVVEPQDLEASRRAFTLLLDQYPTNSKVPDALYKLGKVHFLKGNADRAKAFLDRLIRDFGATDSTAVQLAKDFIAENY